MHCAVIARAGIEAARLSGRAARRKAALSRGGSVAAPATSMYRRGFAPPRPLARNRTGPRRLMTVALCRLSAYLQGSQTGRTRQMTTPSADQCPSSASNHSRHRHDRHGQPDAGSPRAASAITFRTRRVFVPPGAVVLRDLSLTIAPGQFVGLVGAPAAAVAIGSLIPRFYDPTTGASHRWDRHPRIQGRRSPASNRIRPAGHGAVPRNRSREHRIWTT